ncbi:PfkB family carbohydrate kinase [Blastochloris tepida]|uniref:Ketodeoxygluconokinase n=1 Tax=Blastochloris tepida TaxID=2233851 RepID=A0A348FWE1_9HYPH|nr:PfkB family carbohydrate kinase [Blastochloris tepida]BBF91624.1 ketodeoxygluconokinase [Blastochloris tepida]
MSRVVAIGEVSIELFRGDDGRYALSFGGDVFRTAVRLGRLGVPTAFATALGDDPYSRTIIAALEAEGLATDLIVRIAGTKPNLTLIDTATSGERLVHGWRDGAPARQLFSVQGWGALAEAMTLARLVYVSGVTLSLYDNVGLGRLLATLEVARERGATIAFGGRFQPQGWGGDAARARAVLAEVLCRTDIALANFADEALLYGDVSPAATLDRLAAAGAAEVAVKAGTEGVLVMSGGEVRRVTAGPVAAEQVESLTESQGEAQKEPAAKQIAAGEEFDAGYLAARLTGQPPEEAARTGLSLAEGAIRPAGPDKAVSGPRNGPAKDPFGGQVPPCH